jgi:fluoride exporter
MIVLIGLGGSIGAATRYLLGELIKRNFKKVQPFPLGTLVINLLGSFVLGLLANLHLTNQLQDWIWYLAGVGFCGAFTTFSTFGYETISLLQMKKFRLAIIYVILSVLLGLLAAFMGLII